LAFAKDDAGRGGGGDNMCAASVGAVHTGDAYRVSGTSGVYFLANDTFVPAATAA